MPLFDRSAQLALAVTSVGAGSVFYSNGANDGGHSGIIWIDGSSFNASLQAPCVFDAASEVGSLWTNVVSNVTVAGFTALGAGVNHGAYRLQVNSVASGSNVSAGLNF